jgi:hypothetical protein
MKTHGSAERFHPKGELRTVLQALAFDTDALYMGDIDISADRSGPRDLRVC